MPTCQMFLIIVDICPGNCLLEIKNLASCHTIEFGYEVKALPTQTESKTISKIRKRISNVRPVFICYLLVSIQVLEADVTRLDIPRHFIISVNLLLVLENTILHISVE